MKTSLHVLFDIVDLIGLARFYLNSHLLAILHCHNINALAIPNRILLMDLKAIIFKMVRHLLFPKLMLKARIFDSMVFHLIAQFPEFIFPFFGQIKNLKPSFVCGNTFSFY